MFIRYHDKEKKYLNSLKQVHLKTKNVGYEFVKNSISQRILSDSKK